MDAVLAGKVNGNLFAHRKVKVVFVVVVRATYNPMKLMMPVNVNNIIRTFGEWKILKSYSWVDNFSLIDSIYGYLACVRLFLHICSSKLDVWSMFSEVFLGKFGFAPVIFFNAVFVNKTDCHPIYKFKEMIKM